MTDRFLISVNDEAPLRNGATANVAPSETSQEVIDLSAAMFTTSGEPMRDEAAAAVARSASSPEPGEAAWATDLVRTMQLLLDQLQQLLAAPAVARQQAPIPPEAALVLSNLVLANQLALPVVRALFSAPASAGQPPDTNTPVPGAAPVADEQSQVLYGSRRYHGRPELKDFAESLLRTRMRLGLTQQEAARRVGVGVATWQRYEAGQTAPRTRQGERLRELLQSPQDPPSGVGAR